MMRTKPPFRADHVGSILRTAPLKEARDKFYNGGKITAQQLTDIEDAEIRKVVKKQEEIGLEAITDGEFRRSWWHMDFLGGLDEEWFLVIHIQIERQAGPGLAGLIQAVNGAAYDKPDDVLAGIGLDLIGSRLREVTVIHSPRRRVKVSAEGVKKLAVRRVHPSHWWLVARLA